MKLLQDYGLIKNEQACVSELRISIPSFRCSNYLDIIKTVNASAKKKDNCRYFTFSFIDMDEYEAGKEVLWVDTGFTNLLDLPIYIQFTMSDDWTGGLVGTEDKLLKSQADYMLERGNKKAYDMIMDKLNKFKSANNNINFGYENNKPEEVHKPVKTNESVKEESQTKDGVSRLSIGSTFISNLYSKLMIPNSWSEKSLTGYMNSCIARINWCISDDEDISDYAIYNVDKSRLLLNSGLMDKYGKCIMFVAILSKGMIDASNLLFSESKVNLLNYGFTKQSLDKKIERISFSDSPLDLMFTGNIEDFDLECRSRLEHCVGDRRDRFPDTCRSYTDDILCGDMIKAIELGVELSKYDRNYIKPIYNSSRNIVDFIIPYHVMNDFQKKPELGIVVSFLSGYWQIMTILCYEDAMSDIKLFNMYENETF